MICSTVSFLEIFREKNNNNNNDNDTYDKPDALWYGAFPGDVPSEEIQAALKFFHQEGFLPCHAQSSCRGKCDL